MMFVNGVNCSIPSKPPDPTHRDSGGLEERCFGKGLGGGPNERRDQWTVRFEWSDLRRNRDQVCKRRSNSHGHCGNRVIANFC